MDLAEIDASIHRVFEVGEKFTQDDAKLHVRFFKGAIQDNTEDAVAARKVSKKKMTYLPQDMIEIQKRGEKDVLRRAVWFDETETNALADNVRFRKLYEDFKAGRETKSSGTLLIACGFVSPELAAELAHEKLFTVEQLALVDDGVCQRYMGGTTLRQKAQTFLKLQREATVDVPEELTKANAEIADLKARLVLVEKREGKAK